MRPTHRGWTQTNKKQIWHKSLEYQMITRTRINDLQIEEEYWLVPGLVCPWLTLLSGQPKHGKSLLAGHIALALINQTQVLGRAVAPGNHTIGWMGFDAGWKNEVHSRWANGSNNQIITYDPIRKLNPQIWMDLGAALKEDGTTLLIIDHLYGMAGVLGLNDANQVAQLTNLIRPIYEDYGVAVLLIAQASKGEFSRGRAAHSVALEGEARALIRVFEKRANGARKIELSSNTMGEEILSVILTEKELSLKAQKPTAETASRKRETPDLTRKFLLQANPENLNSWTGAGRELHNLGFSTSDNAGRSMAIRLRKQSLLAEVSGRIVAGSSLLDLSEEPYQYEERSAS
jgi:AAA domain